MEQLIATIEKGQPFFNAIARNKYLKAIRDGFSPSSPSSSSRPSSAS